MLKEFLMKAYFNKKLMFLAVLALLIHSNFIYTNDSNSTVNLFYNAGSRNYISGNYSLAIDNLLRAKKIEPQNKKVKNLLGKAYFKQGLISFKQKKYEVAIQHFKNAALNNFELTADAREWINLSLKAQSREIEQLEQQRHLEEAARLRKQIEEQRKRQEQLERERRQRIAEETQRNMTLLQEEQRQREEALRREQEAILKARLEQQTALRQARTEEQTRAAELKRLEIERKHQIEMERLRVAASRDAQLSEMYQKRLKEIRLFEKRLNENEQRIRQANLEGQKLLQQFMLSQNRNSGNNDKFYAMFLKLMRDDMRDNRIANEMLRNQQFNSENIMRRFSTEIQKNNPHTSIIILIITSSVLIIILALLLFYYKIYRLRTVEPNSFSEIKALPIPKDFIERENYFHDKELGYSENISEKVSILPPKEKERLIDYIDVKVKKLPTSEQTKFFSELIDPLLMDGDDDVRNYVRKFIRGDKNNIQCKADKNICDVISNIERIAKIIDLKTLRNDNSILVANLSIEIAERLDIKEHEIENIYLGALLRDIGYLNADKSIFEKKSSLTEEEKKELSNLIQTGKELLPILSIPENKIEYIEEIIETHHDRFNEDSNIDIKKVIPVHSQIVGISETFFALITKRNYKKTLTIKEALKTILIENNFSSEIIDAFAEVVENKDEFSLLGSEI